MSSTGISSLSAEGLCLGMLDRIPVVFLRKGSIAFQMQAVKICVWGAYILKHMRFLALFGTLFVALNAGTPTAASTLWTELKAKRESLPSVHQEFDVSHTSKTVHASQSSKRQIVLDMSPGQWR